MNPISTLFFGCPDSCLTARAEAQTQATTSRIGVLYLGAPNVNVDVFIQGLRELGHIEGKNILSSTALRREKKIVFLTLRQN